MNFAAWIPTSTSDLELCGRLCLVLAHSLWQFVLLAAVATLVARTWKKATPEQIYALYAAALFVGLMALPITFALTRLPGESFAMSEVASIPQQQSSPAPNSPPMQQLPKQQAVPPYVASSSTVIPANVPASQFSSASNLLSWAPWLVGCYAVGVAVMLLRLMRGLWQNYRLSAQATPVSSGPLFEALRELSRSWSLRVRPALALTERVIVPQVVGLWRPVILLPAAALSGLRLDELEMILAHELAHVRRYDLWANLVQRLSEAVLFFNPAVWYLSRQMSTYREYCCDEATCRLARQTTGDTRLRYAEALLRAVELTQGASHGQKLAALAASGSGPSELRRRVARLFGEPLREPMRITRTGLVMMLVGVAVLVMIPLARQNAAETEAETKSDKVPAKPTVEVVAIGTHDEEPQKWWDAEGKLLDDVPFTWSDEDNVSSWEKVWRRIVFRIKSSPKDAKVIWQVEKGGSWGDATAWPKDGTDSATYFARYFGVPDDAKKLGLRVGIARGPWKLAADSSAGLTATARMDKGIVTSNPFPSDGGSIVVVSHNYEGVDFRVVAVDKEGKKHTTETERAVSASDIRLSQWHFANLLPDRIDHFEFQTREYEWTEIKDLPVEPGETTAKSKAIRPGLVEELDNFAHVPDSGIVAVEQSDASDRFALLNDTQDMHVYRITSKDKFWRTIERRVDSASGHQGTFSGILQGYDEGPQVDLEELYRKSLGDWLFLQRRKHLLLGSQLTNPQAAEAALDRIAAVISDYMEVSQIGDTKVWIYSTPDEFIAAICIWQKHLIVATHITLLEQMLLAESPTTRSMLVKVVDAEGKPLQGAEIFRNHGYVLVDGERTKFENETYFTDENGEATIPLSGITEGLRLWAKKSGYTPQFADWHKEYQTDGDQIPATFEFRLKRGTKIGGIVTNVAGIPIQYARVEVRDVSASKFTRTPAQPEPGKRPVRDVHLAYGSAGVLTDAEGRWSLDNVPADDELILNDEEKQNKHASPLRLRFTHPDYETIDGIDDWQTVWNPPLEQLRDGTARTVMKWIDKKDHGRVNAMRLEQGEQYRNADLSGRYFKGQEIMVLSDNMLAGAKLAGSKWEDMEIPGVSRLLFEADLSNARLINVQVNGQSSGLQRTKFYRATIENSNLNGGGSGFQKAIFDEATITNSTLTGENAAFQAASFNGTRFQSSRLNGLEGAFQSAIFDNAKLDKTSIECKGGTAFQGVSLNNTEFTEADLSSIHTLALESCEFDPQTPPRYDAKTKFPKGFDPQEHGWKLIGEP